MPGCKRCALNRKKGEGKKKRKEKGKEEKMGIKIVLFISPRACFFICAVVIFGIHKENCF